jgi:hypothetical protein
MAVEKSKEKQNRQIRAAIVLASLPASATALLISLQHSNSKNGVVRGGRKEEEEENMIQ